MSLGRGGAPLQLFLLRHADAGDPERWTGPDAERPLTGKGRRQAERMGRFLRATGVGVDVLVASPKVRAAETAEIVGKRLKLAVRYDDRLATGIGLSGLDRLLDEIGGSRPLLVGHDPDLSALVAVLVGAARVPLRKGAAVRLDTDRPLTPGGATLRWLVPPDLLRTD